MDPIIIPPGTEYGEAIRLLQAGLNQLIGEVANKAPGRWTKEDVDQLGREVIAKVNDTLSQSLREHRWRP